MDSGVQPGSWLRWRHVDACLLCRRQAASRGLALMTPRKSSAYKLNTMIECRESPTFSWEDSPETRHVLQKNGGLADLWCVDDGDILCHPILVPSYLQALDVANAKVGAERNPQKKVVIYYVAAVSRKPFPGFHGGQRDACHIQRRLVRNRLQESGALPSVHAGHQRGTPLPHQLQPGVHEDATPARGSTHSIQTAHPSNDPGWSHGWSSAKATLGNSLGWGH